MNFSDFKKWLFRWSECSLADLPQPPIFEYHGGHPPLLSLLRMRAEQLTLLSSGVAHSLYTVPQIIVFSAPALYLFKHNKHKLSICRNLSLHMYIYVHKYILHIFQYNAFYSKLMLIQSWCYDKRDAIRVKYNLKYGQEDLNFLIFKKIFYIISS